MEPRSELEQRWHALHRQLALIRRLPADQVAIDLRRLEEQLMDRMDELEWRLGQWDDAQRP